MVQSGLRLVFIELLRCCYCSNKRDLSKLDSCLLCIVVVFINVLIIIIIIIVLLSIIFVTGTGCVLDILLPFKNCSMDANKV